MSKVCMDGPFEIEMKIYYTDGNGREGAVTFALPKGTVPTKENIDNAIKESSTEAAKHGLRLMTRAEVMQNWLGLVQVAVPGPQRWTEEQLKAWGL